MIGQQRRGRPPGAVTKQTRKAAEFVEANKRSPVVFGSVIGKGGRGCFYRLEDGSTWELSAVDCRAIYHVRWKHLEAA